MASLAKSATITVPIAAQTASPKSFIAQMPNNAAEGKPANMEAVSSTDRAQGQIRRGLGCEATAAPMQVINAMSAAIGNTKITEKSMAGD